MEGWGVCHIIRIGRLPRRFYRNLNNLQFGGACSLEEAENAADHGGYHSVGRFPLPLGPFLPILLHSPCNRGSKNRMTLAQSLMILST